MAEIKAIETFYNGFRFRSRLEARWAVFFDAIGFEYEYEPQGFDLGEGYYYLPDFYLPENNSWVEIKGRFMDNASNEKMLRFCEAKCDVAKGGSKFRILVDQIPYELDEGIPCLNYISPTEYKFMNSKRIRRGFFSNGVWKPLRDEQTVRNGLIKARQARFEHGERG